MTVRRVLKLLGIGFVVTVVRSLAQLAIPPGEQSVLQPSFFVESGTLPLAFAVYGTIAYSLLAALFEAYQTRMSGGARPKGFTWGVLLSLIWTVYLFEPLPHVAPLDRITYPLADSLALLVLGLLVGRFVATDSPRVRRRATVRSVLSVVVLSTVFTLGRLVQYVWIGIYSCFDSAPTVTLIWAVATGLVIGLVFAYLQITSISDSTWIDAFAFGLGVFGVNLLLFNFFMPIVFDADISDMLIRTGVDTLSVAVGCALASLRSSSS